MNETFISFSMLIGSIRWVSGVPAGGVLSDVKVGHLLGVTHNEILAYLHLFSHQGLEDLIGLIRIRDIDLAEDPVLRVHGRVPELVGVHLTKTLVPLDRNALVAKF